MTASWSVLCRSLHTKHPLTSCQAFVLGWKLTFYVVTFPVLEVINCLNLAHALGKCLDTYLTILYWSMYLKLFKFPSGSEQLFHWISLDSEPKANTKLYTKCSDMVRKLLHNCKIVISLPSLAPAFYGYSWWQGKTVLKFPKPVLEKMPVWFRISEFQKSYLICYDQLLELLYDKWSNCFVQNEIHSSFYQRANRQMSVKRFENYLVVNLLWHNLPC